MVAKAAASGSTGTRPQVAIDTDSQLITAVEVLPGNAPDAERALEVVEATEAATECRVEEVIGDCAYGAGETRAAFAANGRTIIAKVPEPYNGELFAKTAFRIDVAARMCTCPNGQTTADLRPVNGGGGTFVFASETCAACPLRAQCTRSRHGRSVQLNPYEALLQQARALQMSPTFAEARRRRQVVEHRIARLVQLGIRQARYFGRTKTLFQLCLAASVANLTLLAAAPDTSIIGRLHAAELPLVAITALANLAFMLAVVADAVGQSTLRTHLIRPILPNVRPLQAGSRPPF